MDHAMAPSDSDGDCTRWNAMRDAHDEDGMEEEKDDGEEGIDGMVCVAIADDALPFPFQRECYYVPVRDGDTVSDVVAQLPSQTVCFWAESSMRVFCAYRDRAWPDVSKAHLYGAREHYCCKALKGTENVLELLRGNLHINTLVHLVVQLRTSSRAETAHCTTWTTFKMFQRCQLDYQFRVVNADKFRDDPIVLVNVAGLRCLNYRLPSVAAFPSQLFWRCEDYHVFTILTDAISNRLGDISALSLALVGSPGIGKSTLAQILAWHVSQSFLLDVIHFHQVRPGCVVFKFFSSCGDLVCGEVDENALPHLAGTLVRAEGRVMKPFVLVDGFTSPTKIPFHVCVTSGSFNATLGQCTVLLPSWSQRDVDALAKSMGSPLLSKRYLDYGGNLRNIFAKDQGAAKASVASAMDRITEKNIPLQLSNLGRCSVGQVDRIRRFRVRDPEKASSYQDPSCWIGQVESAILRRALINRLSLRWIQKLVKASVGTPLHGHAHEMSGHHTAAKLNTFVLRNATEHHIGERRTSARILQQQKQANQSNSEVEPGVDANEGAEDECMDVEAFEIHLDTSKTVFEGRTKDAALLAMRKVATGEATYWAPEFSTFEAIDAVARCVLKTPRSGDVKAIALLQYTVATRKEMLTQAVLTKYVKCLKLAMDEDPPLPVVLVFILPPDQGLQVPTPYDITSYKAQFDVEAPTGELTSDEKSDLDHITSAESVQLQLPP